MADRVQYAIQDDTGEVLTDLEVDLDTFEPLKAGDHVWDDNGVRYRVLRFRRVNADTRDVLLEPDPE